MLPHPLGSQSLVHQGGGYDSTPSVGLQRLLNRHQQHMLRKPGCQGAFCTLCRLRPHPLNRPPEAPGGLSPALRKPPPVFRPQHGFRRLQMMTTSGSHHGCGPTSVRQMTFAAHALHSGYSRTLSSLPSTTPSSRRCSRSRPPAPGSTTYRTGMVTRRPRLDRSRAAPGAEGCHIAPVSARRSDR